MTKISGKYFRALTLPPNARLTSFAPMRQVRQMALIMAVYGFVSDRWCIRNTSLFIGVWVCALCNRWLRPSMGTSWWVLSVVKYVHDDQWKVTYLFD